MGFRDKKISRKERFDYIIKIICEGNNTEYDYLSKLNSCGIKDERVRVKKIKKGCGQHMKLIEEARSLYETDDNEIWCVFDGDPSFEHPKLDQNFRNSVIYLGSNDCPEWLHGAYSFEAFEYWFLLHFEELDGSPMSRDEYIRKLNGYLESIPSYVRYDKDKKDVSEEFFQILIERVDFAIANAEKIDNGSWKPIGQAHERNSITKVYKLVKRILGK